MILADPSYPCNRQMLDHARARKAEDTDWQRIAGLYGDLEKAAPSAVVALNRAVALAMAEGPERGLRELDELTARGELEDYYLLHSARADLMRRLGRHDDPSAS